MEIILLQQMAWVMTVGLVVAVGEMDWELVRVVLEQMVKVMLVVITAIIGLTRLLVVVVAGRVKLDRMLRQIMWLVTEEMALLTVFQGQPNNMAVEEVVAVIIL